MVVITVIEYRRAPEKFHGCSEKYHNDQTERIILHASERIETFILIISHSSISDTSLGLVWFKKGFSLHLNDLDQCTEHAQKI